MGGKEPALNTELTPARSRNRMGRASLATLATLLALATAGCNTTRSALPSDASAMAAVPPGQADAHSLAEAWGERSRANPNDPAAAMNYAQALRANGQRAQAVALLEQVS